MTNPRKLYSSKPKGRHMTKEDKTEHPSVVQRRKIEETRKLRLAQALRENLKKRKEQTRGRKTS